MTTRHRHPVRIDLLALSDSEKSRFIKETRQALRERVEAAKLWRNSLKTTA
jgi:hypothetical protein